MTEQAMSHAPCAFCEIVADRAPAEVVHEWDDALAFVPLNPVVDGHVLVIPKEHTTDAMTGRALAAIAMFRAAEIAERPCNLITSAGVEATQTVFHLHVHIVPRSAGDGLPLPWTPQQEAICG